METQQNREKAMKLEEEFRSHLKPEHDELFADLLNKLRTLGGEHSLGLFTVSVAMSIVATEFIQEWDSRQKG